LAYLFSSKREGKMSRKREGNGGGEKGPGTKVDSRSLTSDQKRKIWVEHSRAVRGDFPWGPIISAFTEKG